MTPFEQLLLILGAIYLSECVVSIPLGALVLCSSWGAARAALRGPLFLSGSRSAGFVLLSPSPLGISAICEQWPISLSPAGLCASSSHAVHTHHRPAPSPVFIAFEDIERVETLDKKLLINSQPLALSSTLSAAASLADLVIALKSAPPHKREKLITRAIAAALNDTAARRRLRAAAPLLRWTRAGSLALMANVFLLLPAAYFMLPLHVWWRWLLISTLYAWFGTVLLFRRAHRKIHGNFPGDRLKQTFMMSLAPTMAMRAAHAASRELFAPFHPLAAAAVAASPAEFHRFARLVLRDMRHPIEPRFADAAPPAAVEAQRWCDDRWLEAVERFMTHPDRAAAAADPPPLPDSPGSAAYCPRCLEQFVQPGATCGTCGLPAVPIPQR